MKLAISGLNSDKHKELIRNIQKTWPLYVSPVQSIFDETDKEDDEKFTSRVKEMGLNEDEINNYRGWYLLNEQYEKYKDQKYIIYNGSPVDLFCEALLLADCGLISNEYIEKVIYYHKKYLQKLDVVWWMPNPEGTEGIKDETDKKMETIYNNIYNNYQTNFDKSPYFNQSHTSSFIRFDTLEYMDEVRLLLNSKGNLWDDNVTNVDEEELRKRLQRYPDLYEIYVNAKNNEILSKSPE